MTWGRKSLAVTGMVLCAIVVGVSAVLAGPATALALLLVALGGGVAGYCLAARRTSATDAVHQARQLDIAWRAMGEAVLSFDLQGQLVRMNPAAETLLQRWNVEERGRALPRLCELRSRGPDGSRRDPVADVLGGRTSPRQERLVLRRRDGSDRIVSVGATPMREEDGSLQGVVVVMQDVTAEHQLEEQVRRDQRARSLAQLASGVAHDFNNLLQVIRMNLEFLGDRSVHDPQGSEYIGEIDRAAARAAELNHQLLALGRSRPLLQQLLDAGQLVSGFLHVIRRLMGATIEVHWVQPTQELWINGDAGELEQVLLNVCGNAREAMPVGGRLSLEVNRTELSVEAAQRWPWARAGHYVVIAIQDSGVGMDDATRARIFEPFFTTQPLGQRAGLGLPVALGVIQQHGGFINVSSRLGHGATFELYLPEQPAPIAPSAEPAAPARGERPALERNILVVEDEPAVRMVATAVLVRHGYRVMEAADGREACEIVRTRGSQLALIVMDVVMPRLGGVDAAREIVQLRPELPIILCTGDRGADAQLLTEGTDRWHVLEKPFGSDALLRAVANALGSPATQPS